MSCEESTYVTLHFGVESEKEAARAYACEGLCSGRERTKAVARENQEPFFFVVVYICLYSGGLKFETIHLHEISRRPK